MTTHGFYAMLIEASLCVPVCRLRPAAETQIRRVFNMSKSQQNYLDQVAQRLHLTADAQSGILFGMQGGLHMMLMRSTSNQNFVSLVFSLTHSGQEPDAAEIKAFVKSNKLIVNYSIRRSRVEFILKPRFGSFKQIDQLEQVTGEVVSLLRTGGYQSCCQNCGQTADTDACIMAGVPSLLCDSCYQQLGHNQEQIQQESAGKPENVLAGVRSTGMPAGRGLHCAAGTAGLCSGFVWHCAGCLHAEGI